MRILYFGRVAAFLTAVLLAACMGPETPQEVTRAFWTAAIEGDTGNIAKYSTLANPENYDGFSIHWANYRPSWGKVIIDGDQASVVSEFVRPEDSRKRKRSFVTYLVRRGDVWLVDYDRTARSINGGVFGDLFNKFDQFSKDISQQFSSSADEASAQMERMLEEFGKAQEELSEQATEALDKYADELREALREMEESIHRALEENNENLSIEDQQLLQSAATDLRQSHDSMTDGSLESLVENSQNINAAQRKLEAVEDDSLSSYQARWRQLADELSADAQELRAEFQHTRL